MNRQEILEILKEQDKEERKAIWNRYNIQKHLTSNDNLHLDFDCLTAEELDRIDAEFINMAEVL